MEFKNYKLTWVRNEDKVGQKSGKPYTALSVKVEGSEEWWNGFGNEVTKTWQVGDVVPLHLFHEEWNGKMQGKVSPPNKGDFMTMELTAIKKRLSAAEQHLNLPKLNEASSVAVGASPSPQAPAHPIEASSGASAAPQPPVVPTPAAVPPATHSAENVPSQQAISAGDLPF